MYLSDTQRQVLDALFFAASFQGPGHFVTQGDLTRETGLPQGDLADCVQALLLKGFATGDGQGAVHITKSGITEMRA
jgi:hypothetical protein